MNSLRIHPAPTHWYNHILTAYPPCTHTLLRQAIYSHILTAYPPCIHCYAKPYTVIHCVSTLHPPTVTPSHIQSHTHCVPTLHPPTVTTSHIESNNHCVSTLHPPTVMPSHIESYTPCVSTLQLSIAGLANHHHSSLCCCSIAQAVCPGSSHNICLPFFRSVGLTSHCTNCFPLAACYDSNYYLLLGPTDLHPASPPQNVRSSGLTRYSPFRQ